jgi:hypothetical protein
MLLRLHDHHLRDGNLALRPLTEEDWPHLLRWIRTRRSSTSRREETSRRAFEKNGYEVFQIVPKEPGGKAREVVDLILTQEAFQARRAR